MAGHFNMGNIREVKIAEYWKHDPGLARVRTAHEPLDFSDLKICAVCNADQYVTMHYFHNPALRGQEG